LHSCLGQRGVRFRRLPRSPDRGARDYSVLCVVGTLRAVLHKPPNASSRSVPRRSRLERRILNMLQSKTSRHHVSSQELRAYTSKPSRMEGFPNSAQAVLSSAGQCTRTYTAGIAPRTALMLGTPLSCIRPLEP